MKLKYLDKEKPALWYIEWWDHVTHSEGGWKDADVEIDPMLILNVGWVLRENEQCIYVVNNMDPEDGTHLHGQVVLKSTIERAIKMETPPHAVHQQGAESRA